MEDIKIPWEPNEWEVEWPEPQPDPEKEPDEPWTRRDEP
jgi:hypothetical protein